MPFYEYRAVDEDQSCDLCIDTFEVTQSMLSDSLVECPECQNPVKKIISLLGAVLVGGREANQYRDIKSARYWRDKNGIRHPVTQADGYTGSATVTQQTASESDIKTEKIKDRKQVSKQRLKAQESRIGDWNRKQIEK